MRAGEPLSNGSRLEARIGPPRDRRPGMGAVPGQRGVAAYPHPLDASAARGLVAGRCVYVTGTAAFVGLQPIAGAISRAMVSSILAL